MRSAANCTDFHALLLDWRGRGNPCEFENWIPLPADKHDARLRAITVAEFYLNGYDGCQWTFPRHGKDLRDASIFLARHDANRVQFSVGRDVMLAPPQAGPPLNYFIYCERLPIHFA